MISKFKVMVLHGLLKVFYLCDDGYLYELFWRHDITSLNKDIDN